MNIQEVEAAGPGRPRKIARIRPNSGRKHSMINESSYSTIRRRAIEITNNPRYNIEVLEMAIKILKKEYEADLEFMEVDESDNEVENGYTKESGLALALEYGLGKRAYNGIARDLKARKCNLYVSYTDLAKAKTDCKPQRYTISEVFK